jgi:hypothetical protein
MTTPVVPSAAGVMTDESRAPARRTYRTTTSFVAVHFDQATKGQIIFLPYGATFQVIGPSSCLPAGFEVVFEHRHYNVFEIDVLVRSTPICEPIRARRRAAAA